MGLRHIQKLRLENCGITSVGVETLAQTLVNSRISVSFLASVLRFRFLCERSWR